MAVFLGGRGAGQPLLLGGVQAIDVGNIRMYVCSKKEMILYWID